MSALLFSLLPVLIASLSPVVTAQVKKIVPRIPKLLVPLTSVAVGTVGAFAADYFAGANIGGANGAVLGAVGVAVREVVDQFRKALPSDVSV